MLYSLLPLIGLAVVCIGHEVHAHDDHTHAPVLEKREYPQVPLTPPYRPLVWGDFNVIHTTDTHGWLLGHQKSSWPEPNYSGDLGDFASFVTRMKRIALEKDVDILLVDSGDLHDGTGLSDGYPPGGVDGQLSDTFLQQLGYDLMTIGNHELYDYNVTYEMYTNFVPQLNGRYLTSNANITLFNSDGTNVSVPIGDRYAKFMTRKGRRVTSLGVLFNFTGNSKGNTTVQPVEQMVKEPWFLEAVTEEPDVFLLVGHMPVSNDSWPAVYDAINNMHPNTPILIFGGHTHVRDCQQYGGRSMALESGRFMETIGWMSADLDAAKGNTNNITFSRRYLDQNRVTYEYHTNMPNSTFDTPFGRQITHGLEELASDFDLAYLYGTAPQDYTLTRDPYSSGNTVMTLFIAEAAPFVFAINNPRNETHNIILANSGIVRYDVLMGSFTKNDQLTAVPYTNQFLYIPDVNASIANQVLPCLNNGNCTKHSGLVDELQSRGYVESRYRSWLEDMGKRRVTQVAGNPNLTLGYVTTDNCTGPNHDDLGDDTLHVAVSDYSKSIPHYIGSNPPNVTSDTPIDLVFEDYIETKVLNILNAIQSTVIYTNESVSLYTNTTATEVLAQYAQAKWN